MEKPLYSIVAQRGLVESVDTDNAAAYVAVDAAVAATVLTMRTTSIFETEDGTGQVSIAGIVYSYSAVDPAAFTLTLSSGLLRAVEDGDPVEAYPAAPTTTAAISLDTGEAITARVAAAHLIFLKSGQRLGVDREAVDVYKDGDDYVTLDVHNTRVQVTPEANPDLHEITNLCTDPKPANYENWVGGAGFGGGGAFEPTITGDSTFADRGLNISYDPGYLNGVSGFAPFGTGPAVTLASPDVSELGPIQAIPFTTDLSFSYRAFSPEFPVDLVSHFYLFDASLDQITVALGANVSHAPLTLAQGAEATIRGTADYASLIAAYPTAVWLVFTMTPHSVGGLDGQKAYFGSCSYTATATAVPYGDVDTDGWVDNGDGTSTGTVDLSTPPSWWQVTDKPTVFYVAPPPVTVASQAAMLALTAALVGQVAVRSDSSETYELAALPPATLANWTLIAAVGADGATGPEGPPGETGATGAPSPMVWVVDDVTAEGIPLDAIPDQHFLLDMATGDFFQIYQT